MMYFAMIYYNIIQYDMMEYVITSYNVIHYNDNTVYTIDTAFQAARRSWPCS